jgi:hypothetical protein
VTFRVPRLARLVLGVVLAAGLGVGSGCGYRVLQYRGAIPGAETLAIRALANGTLEPGVEAVVLDALRREALQRDGLRLIDDPDAADLVLSGRVRSLSVGPRSFTSVVLSVEYEVVLGLALTVERKGGEPIPIDSRAQIERDRYLASADLEAMRKNRREAIHRLAAVLADRVYDSLYESAAAASAASPDSGTATP